MRKKAAEELKKEQERKSAERRKVIDERCGKPQSLDGLGECKFHTYEYISLLDKAPNYLVGCVIQKRKYCISKFW